LVGEEYSQIRCFVKNLMSRNKFEEIKKKIRFYNLEDKNNKDPVWKVRKLHELFRKNLTQFGWFMRNLSTDEIMVKYFGRLAIKQCILNKPIRFGIKLWVICSSDGFLFDFDIYCGKKVKKMKIHHSRILHLDQKL